MGPVTPPPSLPPRSDPVPATSSPKRLWLLAPVAALGSFWYFDGNVTLTAVTAVAVVVAAAVAPATSERDWDWDAMASGPVTGSSWGRLREGAAVDWRPGFFIDPGPLWHADPAVAADVTIGSGVDDVVARVRAVLDPVAETVTTEAPGCLVAHLPREPGASLLSTHRHRTRMWVRAEPITGTRTRVRVVAVPYGHIDRGEMVAGPSSDMTWKPGMSGPRHWMVEVAAGLGLGAEADDALDLDAAHDAARTAARADLARSVSTPRVAVVVAVVVAAVAVPLLWLWLPV